jgi:hypothetical protein
LIGLYFAPTIVGAIRKVPNIGSVIVINLFLGWSRGFAYSGSSRKCPIERVWCPKCPIERRSLVLE